MIGDDIAFGSDPYFHPDVMRKLVFSHWKRMAAKINLPWLYHSDGNLLPVMEDLLGLGMNAIHPIEPYGTMDTAPLRFGFP